MTQDEFTFLIFQMKRTLNIRNVFKSLFFAASCFLVISCGSSQLYEGKKRPANQVAIINFGDLRLHTVDGKPAAKRFEFTTKAEVLPGKRTIGFRSYRDLGMYIIEYPPAYMTFEAKAGHLYRPYLNIKSDSPLKTAILDVTSGKVVAEGIVGQ